MRLFNSQTSRRLILIRTTLAVVVSAGLVILLAWNGSLPDPEDSIPENEVPQARNDLIITRTLPIAPRLQWRDRAGYCGECAIQQCALYYGNYVSQYVCRQIIDTTQQQDVLVRVNADLVLDALRLKYDEFGTSQVAPPQYKAYLAWTKKHLHQGHPVILTMFVRGHECWDYDHIVLATGVESGDDHTYHPEDTLYFHDLFELKPEVRPFKTLHDSRKMKGNGVKHYFCIPAQYDFGCAITGIDDKSGNLLPIQVTVNLPREPDIVKGEKPVDLTLEITVRDLTPGETYVLYRYDNHTHLPNDDYSNSKYVSARSFEAKGATHAFTDQCQSNGASFYRCLKAAPSKS